MSIDYKFIGWYRDEAENSDKVWGVIRLTKDQRWGENNYVSFWGRRGKKLQTKMLKEYDWTVEDMISKKESKGYRNINYQDLNGVYPEFQNDLEKTAFWAMFKV